MPHPMTPAGTNATSSRCRDSGSMGLTMNLISEASAADMEPDGVEWQHTWTPSQPHDSEFVQRLPALQRLLLTTDGTVTTALGTVISEPVAVWLLDQRLHALDYDDYELQLQAGCELLLRRVLLYGSRWEHRCCWAPLGSPSAACRMVRSKRCSTGTFRSVSCCARTTSRRFVRR